MIHYSLIASGKRSACIAISALLFLSLSYSEIVFAAPPPNPVASESVLDNFKFQVPYPGLSITQAQFNSGEAIGFYIAGIYKWAAGFGMIIAVLAFIYAGVLWLTARGDSGQVGESKKILVNAIVGVVLLLGSYTLLWAVNPRLVSFKPIKLTTVQKLDIEFDVAKEEDNVVRNPDAAVGTGSGELRNGVPYFNQGNPAWKNLRNPRTQNTIGATGCGITAYAMVAKFYGKNVTPADVFQLNGQDNDYAKLKNITQLGLNHERVDANRMDQLVRSGKPVILRTVNRRFTTDKHFIVITGFNGTHYTINDPGHSSFTTATREEVTEGAVYYEYVHP